MKTALAGVGRDALPIPATVAARIVADLHERRGRALWGLGRRLNLSDEEAADAVQEGLLRLWRELAAGRAVADPDAWIFRVVYRLAMDEHRFRRSVQGVIERIGLAGHPPAGRDPTDSLAVWSEVDRLPARQRAVLYLHYRVDLPFEAVGAALGITANGARNHASAAIARLRREFGTSPEERRWTETSSWCARSGMGRRTKPASIRQSLTWPSSATPKARR